MAVKYTYQQLTLQDPPKFIQIGIFGLKLYHLATLIALGTAGQPRTYVQLIRFLEVFGLDGFRGCRPPRPLPLQTTPTAANAAGPFKMIRDQCYDSKIFSSYINVGDFDSNCNHLRRKRIITLSFKKIAI
jgi:hypothetical protein